MKLPLLWRLFYKLSTRKINLNYLAKYENWTKWFFDIFDRKFETLAIEVSDIRFRFPISRLRIHNISSLWEKLRILKAIVVFFNITKQKQTQNLESSFKNLDEIFKQ